MTSKNDERGLLPPLPEKLEPFKNNRTLMTSVRIYFHQQYSKIEEWLKSVNNKTSITGNLYFDRHKAVEIIKEAARQAKDPITSEAMDGEIYKCMSRVANEQGISLKLRRAEFRRIKHNPPQQPEPAE